jgi:hypothetical protein
MLAANDNRAVADIRDLTVRMIDLAAKLKLDLATLNRRRVWRAVAGTTRPHRR